jgi:hypothetical protein
LLLDYECHCFSVLARGLKAQLNTHQGWKNGEAGDAVARDEGGGFERKKLSFCPLHMLRILRNAAQSLS